MAEKMIVSVDGQKVEARVVEVDPVMAKEWLERNEDNRSMSRKHVNMLTRAMERNEFTFVADPVRFDRDGRLIDGQHRLRAIVLSNTVQPMLVVSGLMEDSQQYMDAGRRRSPGDQLKLQLGTRDSSTWASVVRLLIRWDAEDLITQILVPSIPEVVEYADENREALERAVQRATQVYRGLGGGSKAACAAVYFEAEKRDPVRAAAFWAALASGENLHRGEPVFALRDALLRRRKVQRWNLNEELAAYVRAWNADRKGQSLTKLQLGREGLTDKSFEVR